MMVLMVRGRARSDLMFCVGYKDDLVSTYIDTEDLEQGWTQMEKYKLSINTLNKKY